MNRRLFGFGVFGLVVIMALFLVYSFYSSQTILQITNKNADSIKVYKALLQDTDKDDISYDSKSSPIAELYNPGKFTIKVKKNTSYVVVGSSKKPFYETSTQRVSVGGSPSSVSIELVLSDAYLKQLLVKEQPLALAALQSKYPTQFNNFTATGGKLYKEGQWYAVKLVPKAGGDAYRVVLKKQSDNWTVVTDPPAIILSAPVYPSVPREVLSDINNF